MGTQQSTPEQSVVANPPRPHAPPADSLSPSLGLNETQCKPITCSGWVVRQRSSSWSTNSVEFSHEVVIPAPLPHQVRVKVYAAGVNPMDVHRTTFADASSYVAPQFKKHVRAHQRGEQWVDPFPFPYICGIEGAGIIEAVGGVTEGATTSNDLQVGDSVMYLADMSQGTGGTFCQYAVVDKDIVCKIPQSDGRHSESIDFVEAAALPNAAETAYIALFDKLRIERGRSIFVSGASGGVGSIIVQLAHHFGLYVFASCSTPHVPYVESLRADCVLDYTKTDVVKEILRRSENYGIDYVVEASDAQLAEHHSQVLRFGGSMCVLTGLFMPTSDMAFERQHSHHYIFLGMFHKSRVARSQLRYLSQSALELYRQGAFRLQIEEVPFERASVALDVVAQGHTCGKIVVTRFHADDAAANRRRQPPAKYRGH